MENLGIDNKLLLAQLINFALFFVLFKKFISTPFLKFLHGERKKEEDKHKVLAELKKQEEEMAKMEQEMRSKGKRHVDEMLMQAKEASENARGELLAQAQKEAAQIVEKGRQQIEEERAHLYEEVKKRTADLALLLIKDALKDYLTEDAKKALTNTILHNVSNTTPFRS